MKKPAYYFLGFLLSVFVLVGIVENPAMAQGKAKAQNGKSTVKVLFNDDRVRVVEVTYKPGDESNKNYKILPFRVMRALTSGTLQRTYPDGKIEKVAIKAGEVRVFDASNPFSAKNVGTSDLVLYGVLVKRPKE
jgi:mannose-6-phosphate isomerase-like protein (cupin superfamily)